MKNILTLVTLLSANNAAFAQLTATQEAWIANGFRNPVMTTLTFDQEQEFRINPTVVVFRDSGWTKEQVIERLAKVESIYTHCRVDLGEVTLIEVDSVIDQINTENISITNNFEISDKIPFQSRPVLFYGKNGDKRRPDAVAWAWSKDFELEHESLFDTIWISFRSVEFDLKLKETEFSTEAHELGHLLLEEGHIASETGLNLMSAYTWFMSSHLAEFQCEKIRKSNLLSRVHNTRNSK